MLKFAAALTFLALACPSFAVEREPEDKPAVLKPATRYSGSTPIDMTNGKSWDNGTQGLPNEDYESWAKSPTIVAGLDDRTYSYSQKDSFVNTLEEQVTWGESAIRNWKATTNEFPDALAYSKAAVEKMQPELDKLKDATKKVSGAGESGWQGAENDARHALISFRLAYMSMHRNVQVRQFAK